MEHLPTAPAAIPASFAQEQLWFLDQLSSGGSTYNILLSWKLTGAVSSGALRDALTAAVARHDALRMTFRDDEGTPRVVVADTVHVGLPVIDLRSLESAAREQRVSQEVSSQQNQHFDLNHGPLFAFELIRLSDHEYVFLESFHHSILDGWSSSIVNSDISRFYELAINGKHVPQEPSNPTYSDFITDQRARLTSEVLESELQFWDKRLQGLKPLDLPTDRTRAQASLAETAKPEPGDTLVHTMDERAYAALTQSAANHGTSKLAVLAAALSVVMSRYSGSTDVPIGIPVLGRTDAEWEGVVGMFINLTVLRTHTNPELTFRDLQERVMDSLFEVMDHQEVPFSKVVERAAPDRTASRNPLFQVSLQVLDAASSGQTLALTNTDVEFIPARSDTSRFDVSLNLFDSGDAMQVSAEYSTDLFDQWRIIRLVGHIEEVIRQAAVNPSVKLSNLASVTVDEATELVAAGRDPRTRLTAIGTELLEKTDLPMAVVDGDGNLTPCGIPGEVVIGTSPWTDEIAGQVVATRSVTGVPTRPTGVHAVWEPDLSLTRVRTRTPNYTSGPDVAGPTVPKDDSLAPADAHVQRDVTQAFIDVLEIATLGRDDNFFESGGSSLRAMRVISRVNKKLGIKLSVRTLYAEPTIRAVTSAAAKALTTSRGPALDGQ